VVNDNVGVSAPSPPAFTEVTAMEYCVLGVSPVNTYELVAEANVLIIVPELSLRYTLYVAFTTEFQVTVADTFVMVETLRLPGANANVVPELINTGDTPDANMKRLRLAVFDGIFIKVRVGLL
jgi:hypothetical protein